MPCNCEPHHLKWILNPPLMTFFTYFLHFNLHFHHIIFLSLSLETLSSVRYFFLHFFRWQRHDDKQSTRAIERKKRCVWGNWRYENRCVWKNAKKWGKKIENNLLTLECRVENKSFRKLTPSVSISVYVDSHINSLLLLLVLILIFFSQFYVLVPPKAHTCTTVIAAKWMKEEKFFIVVVVVGYEK